MTIVNLVALTDMWGGRESDAFTVTAAVHRGGKSAIRVSADEVTFPKVLTSKVTDVADPPLDLGPIPVDCYWHIEVVQYSARSRGLPRDVAAPTGESVDFGALVDIIPDTGEPDPNPTLWASYLADLTGLRDDTVVASSTAGTSAFNAGASAAAALGHENAAAGSASTAAGAATAAGTSATAAAGSATAAATSATNAGTSATAASGSASAAATSATASDTARAASVTAKTASETALAQFNLNAANYLTLIAAAKNPDLIVTGTITLSGDLITSAQVVWPDGTPGVLTITSRHSTGAVLAYNIMYGSPVTKTFTQPTITRTSTGAATTVPQIVIT